MKDHREYQLGKLAIWLGFVLVAYLGTLGHLRCQEVNAANEQKSREYWRGRVDGMENSK